MGFGLGPNSWAVLRCREFKGIVSRTASPKVHTQHASLLNPRNPNELLFL